MNQKWDGIERRTSLRAEAETVVDSFSPKDTAAQPAEVLLHELLVHKVELEMQNEELRRAHIALEEARDRYVHLYEFAPVGFITINREGMIGDINLTGSALLGVDRAKLVGRRFSKFVALKDRDQWHRLFINMMENPKADKQGFGLEMEGADGSTLYVHLNCLRREIPDSPPSLWVAMTDIRNIELAAKE